MSWLELEWNRPDRTDHYLMQIAVEIRRVLSKNPSSHKLEHLLIKFIRKLDNKANQKSNQGMTKDQISGIALATWLGRMTMAPKGLEHLWRPMHRKQLRDKPEDKK